MISTTFVLAALVAFARAQNIPAQATEAELERVEAEWNNSGFNEALQNSQSFGIELEAMALLTVQYGDTIIENGNAYEADAVATPPQFYVTPTAEAASSFSQQNQFTLILADASAAGMPDPRGDYRHFLANGLSGGAPASGDNLTFTPSDGQVVTQYAGPFPDMGNGAHRYAWMMFAQPANFAPQQNATGDQPAGPWSVQQYVQSSGLGDLVAAAFFTVQRGDPTFAPVATSAAPSTSAAASSSAAPSSAGRPTSAGANSASAPAQTSAQNGADSVAPAFAAGLGLAAASLFILA